LELEIITPEGIEYKEEIKFLGIAGPLGRLGILPDHADLLTTVETGEVKIVLSDDRVFYMASGEVLLEVDSNKVTLLSDSIEEIYKTQLMG